MTWSPVARDVVGGQRVDATLGGIQVTIVTANVTADLRALVARLVDLAAGWVSPKP